MEKKKLFRMAAGCLFAATALYDLVFCIIINGASLFFIMGWLLMCALLAAGCFLARKDFAALGAAMLFVLASGSFLEGIPNLLYAGSSLFLAVTTAVLILILFDYLADKKWLLVPLGVVTCVIAIATDMEGLLYNIDVIITPLAIAVLSFALPLGEKEQNNTSEERRFLPLALLLSVAVNYMLNVIGNIYYYLTIYGLRPLASAIVTVIGVIIVVIGGIKKDQNLAVIGTALLVIEALYSVIRRLTDSIPFIYIIPPLMILLAWVFFLVALTNPVKAKLCGIVAASAMAIAVILPAVRGYYYELFGIAYGIAIYLLCNHSDTSQKRVREAVPQSNASKPQCNTLDQKLSKLEDIEKLQNLMERGIITREEFEEKKHALLSK